MRTEAVFTMDTSSIKYGSGATHEVGYDMKQLGAGRVMVLTDSNLTNSETVDVVMRALRTESIDAVLYDRVRGEPTDLSLKEEIKFAVDANFSGYVAVGGGSTMDTAKAANLYATYPAEFLTYVNYPIGEGKLVPGKLNPLIAVPTTAGTGSETTGVVIFDLLEIRAKTGIAHRALRPNMGIVDPKNTETLTSMVAACSGLDVLCHALESLTALPFHQRAAPEHSGLRPAYQGANPISDIWSARAIDMVAKNIVRAVEDSSDEDARGQMLLAASFAGIGFGNAGVHLPHGMSYPVAGMVRDYVPDGYAVDHPIIPHGMSVVLNAPAVFRFTAMANPEAHLYAAGLMGVDVKQRKLEHSGDLLSDALVDLMKRTGMPNGLSAVGFDSADIDDLVAGTLPQHRVTKLSPRVAQASDLEKLFLDSMACW